MKIKLFLFTLMATALGYPAYGGDNEETIWTFSTGTQASASEYYTRSGIAFTLKSSSDSYTVTQTKDEAFPESLTLQSIKIEKIGSSVANLWGIVCDSQGVAVAIANGGNTAAGNSVTFDFASSSGNQALSADTCYILTFYRGNNNATTSASTGAAIGQVYLPEDTALGGTSAGGHSIPIYLSTSTGLSNTDVYYVNAKIGATAEGVSDIPSITITATKNVPEPATAALGLLALAGLAARRRR